MAVPKRVIDSAVPDPVPTPRVGAVAGAAPASATELDRLVHERVRLGMLSALAARDACTFNDLKALLGPACLS